MVEIWKPIANYPGYEVSNLGRIVSHKRKMDRILVPKEYESGYLSVGLSKHGKRKDLLIHRLVLSTFSPIDGMESLEVNHLDENKKNNCLDNLVWSTPKENCNYGMRNGKIKLRQSKRVLCVETGIIYDSAKQASELTGTCRSSISNCLKGKRNKAGNYHWEVAQ